MRGMLTVFFISYFSSLSVHAQETVVSTQQNTKVSSQVRVVVNIPVRTQLTLDNQHLKAQVNTQQSAVVSELLEDNAGKQRVVYTATSL